MGRHSRDDDPASSLPSRAAGGPGRLGPPTPLRYGPRGKTRPPAPEAEPGYSAFGQAEVGFNFGGPAPQENEVTFHEPGFGQITFGDGGPAEPASFAAARDTGYAARPGFTPHSADGGPATGRGRPDVEESGAFPAAGGRAGGAGAGTSRATAGGPDVGAPGASPVRGGRPDGGEPGAFPAAGGRPGVSEPGASPAGRDRPGVSEPGASPAGRDRPGVGEPGASLTAGGTSGVGEVPFGGPPFGPGDPSPPGTYAQPLPPGGSDAYPALQPRPDQRVTDELRRRTPEPPADQRTTAGLPRPPREAPYPTHGTGSHHAISGTGSHPALPSAGSRPAPGTSTGSYPALPGTSSGSYPALPNSSSGSYPATPNTSSGSYPAVPNSSSGSYPAVSESRPSRSGSYPVTPGEGPGTRSGSYRAVDNPASTGSRRAIRADGTATGSRRALPDDSAESRATASGRFRVSEERKGRNTSTGSRRAVPDDGTSTGSRRAVRDDGTTTGNRRAVRDDNTSTGSRRAVRDDSTSTGNRSTTTGSHRILSEGKGGSTSTGSRRAVREAGTSTGSRRAVPEGRSTTTGSRRSVSAEGPSTASGTHRAMGPAVKRRKIAKWPIFTGAFIVLVVVGLLGWAWANNVLSSRAEAQANACTDGDSNITVMVTPGIQQPVTAAADRWNQAKTVVHAHCIHVDVHAAPSQQVLDGLTGKTDIARMGGVPAAWVPENSFFINQLQTAKPGMIGAPPESVASASGADYPFVGLAGNTIDDVQARAAQVFRDFLREPAQAADFQKAGISGG